MNRRIHSSGLHLLLSASVAALAAVLVFVVWYPSPYGEMAGGLGLFGLLVSVDVVLGPLLTAVAANPRKPSREFRRDLSAIVVIQLAAFGYGMYSIALARPAYIAFEIDRLRVVTAADIDSTQLAAAQPALRSLAWCGPKLIAAVKPTDPAEQMRSVELGVAGIDLSMIPANWREYAPLSDEVWRKARPVSMLLAKYPQSKATLQQIAAASGTSVESLRFLPLQSRQASWVSVIANPGARIVGHLPLDGFF